MKKISRNQKGFTAAEGLLIILILVVLGGIGYMVYHNNHKDKTVSTTNTSKTSASSTYNKATSANYDGWSTYTDTSGWFTLKYPSNWTNNTAQAGSTVTEGPSQTQTTLTSNGQGNLGPTSLGQNNNNFLIVTNDTYSGSVQTYIDSNDGSDIQGNNLTINGYQAHYGTATNNNGDTYRTYQVFNNGKVAILSFLVTTQGGQSYSSYEAVEDQIAKSIHFLN